MNAFDEFIAIDWSGAKTYTGVSVASCGPGHGAPSLVEPPTRHWTRAAVAEYLGRKLNTGSRLLIGFDFAFALPSDELGYVGLGDVAKGAFDLWDLVEAVSGGEPDFGCSSVLESPHFVKLFWQGPNKPRGWQALHRLTEAACGEFTGAHPETVFKLIGPKQVGKSSLTGMRTLRQIRLESKDRVGVWPFEKGRQSTIVEIFPTVFRKKGCGTIGKLREPAALNDALRGLGSHSAVGLEQRISADASDALVSAAGIRNWVRTCNADLPVITSARALREGWIADVDVTSLAT